MKRTGFTGYIYDFSVDYYSIAVDDIKDIHKYLMKKKIYIMISTCLKDTSRKATYKKCLYLVRKCFISDHYFHQV